MNRREFLTVAGASGLARTRVPVRQARATKTDGDREYWVGVLKKIADPVLTNLANGTLKQRMPIEQAAGANRAGVTHLEAVGRLLAGIAPWLELPLDDTPEGTLRRRYRDLATAGVARSVDPASADFLNFTRERQPVVDAAFLAQGLLRAPRAVAASLDAATKRHLVDALQSTRVIIPAFSNWLLFSATIEAALFRLGAAWDRVRVDYALRQHDEWYKGDGLYGDGPEFHWDYYNSFVIHPMLIDVLDACGDESAAWRELRTREQQRARRYAAIQERLIAPDGSYPPIGRSLAYRFGAFHALAQAVLRHALPEHVTPAQVRSALTAVIRKSIEAPDTFDAEGWLRIGFCGHQPAVGEAYISTGSLYLCSAGLLPLGLPAADEFWTAAPQPWTSARAWSGQGFAIDHAL